MAITSTTQIPGDELEQVQAQLQAQMRATTTTQIEGAPPAPRALRLDGIEVPPHIVCQIAAVRLGPREAQYASLDAIARVVLIHINEKLQERPTVDTAPILANLAAQQAAADHAWPADEPHDPDRAPSVLDEEQL